MESQSEYRATATGTEAFATQTGTNAAGVATPVGILAGVGVVGALMM